MPGGVMWISWADTRAYITVSGRPVSCLGRKRPGKPIQVNGVFTGTGCGLSIQDGAGRFFERRKSGLNNLLA